MTRRTDSFHPVLPRDDSCPNTGTRELRVPREPSKTLCRLAEVLAVDPPSPVDIRTIPVPATVLQPTRVGDGGVSVVDARAVAVRGGSIIVVALVRNRALSHIEQNPTRDCATVAAVVAPQRNGCVVVGVV